MTVVTHHLADEPRAAVSEGVRVVETGRRVDWFRHHYADAALEYLLGPLLIRHIPKDVDTLVCFGPPSMPALRWARRRGWGAPGRPLLAFLYEPPRFVDRDRAEVVAGLGALGKVMQPFFRLYGTIDRRLVRAADTLLANGPYGASRLRATYGRAAIVLTHGVDFGAPDNAAVAAVRARYGLPGDAPIVLTVNQLHPRKRIDLFIRALAALRRRHSTAVGLIVGRGVDETRLRAEAARCAIADAVTFAGFVPDEDLPAVYRCASVYLHTGRDETFGLSVLEAAWSGVPVVAVGEGGPRDILRDGANGWLVPADMLAIVDALERVLDDPVGVGARAEAARADVRARFRWEAGAAALIAEAERLRGGAGART